MNINTEHCCPTELSYSYSYSGYLQLMSYRHPVSHLPGKKFITGLMPNKWLWWKRWWILISLHYNLCPQKGQHVLPFLNKAAAGTNISQMNLRCWIYCACLVLCIQCISTLEGQQGDIRRTAEVQKMNKRSYSRGPTPNCEYIMSPHFLLTQIKLLCWFTLT